VLATGHSDCVIEVYREYLFHSLHGSLLVRGKRLAVLQVFDIVGVLILYCNIYLQSVHPSGNIVRQAA
jgi:hypothetical protein